MASDRPGASTLLEHPFVQFYDTCNDDDYTTDGGNVNTTPMATTGMHYY